MGRISFLRVGMVATVATALASPGITRGGYLSDYAVFGRKTVIVNGANINGVVASDGDITVNPFSTFGGLTGGGSLYGSLLGSTTVNGNVTFNGDVTFGGSNINGAINSGGNVDIGNGATTQAITASGNVLLLASTTTGNIVAGGNFSNTVFGVVNGNVAANANATVNGTINGNVTYGNTVSVGTFGAIKGSSNQGMTSVNPASYTQTHIPTPASFTAGGPDVTAGGSASNPLAPGSYGALNIGTSGELYLTSGNYYFTSFNFNGDKLNFLNVGTQNHVNIFVSGDAFEGPFAGATVNGLAYNLADSSLASDILLETLGNYSQSSFGGVDFFGTIFAPDGDVEISSYSNLTGQIIAGGQVTISNGFTQKFVPMASTTVPTPMAVTLTAIGVLLSIGMTYSPTVRSSQSANNRAS